MTWLAYGVLALSVFALAFAIYALREVKRLAQQSIADWNRAAESWKEAERKWKQVAEIRRNSR